MGALKATAMQNATTDRTLSPERVSRSAAVLQGMVLSLIDRLVQQKNPLSIDIPEYSEDLLQLARIKTRAVPWRRGRPWLSIPGARRLARLSAVRRRTFAKGELFRSDRLIFKAYWKLHLKRDLGFPRWRRHFLDHLHLRLGGRPGMLELNLAVAGEAAWLEPSFQREISAKLSGYLKRSYLFPDGRAPIPHLSTRVFWLLLALVKTRPAGFLLRARTRFRKARGVWGSLQTLARSRGLASGWAGFWDQWLILEAVRLRGAAFDEKSPLEAAVAGLPLMRQQSRLGAQSHPVQGPPAKGIFARFKRWRLYLRSVLFPRSADAPVPVAISDPSWRESLPVWYEPPEPIPSPTLPH